MRKQQSYQWKQLELGTCYYPEQWDRSLWREDLRRMKDAGIYTIRIAEFAWNRVEPSEGVFTFDFFDDFLDIAEEEQMKVIFGTPTAAPPIWLTEKYPEVLNCRIDGTMLRHGMRRHYNYNSPKYRELSARIVEQIARHYGPRSCIIGWQIDNELNCETNEFYSESDTFAFRSFLQRKYKKLDALNAAWGTSFWNQIYNSWEEVYVPRTTIYDKSNPHQTLDYKRFVSESAISYCQMQSDILRSIIPPHQFITTNGMFGNLDNHRMTDECLDVYTFDSYPDFAFIAGTDPKHTTGLNDRQSSKALTEVRSICPHFGIMEQQSGANGWNTSMNAPAPRPGQMMLWTMQSIAHGADYVSFFRWRTACFGTEIYWHGILDYDNRDNRKLAEVKRIRDRVQAIRGVTGGNYRAEVGLLKDYDNVWDSELDIWHGGVAHKSEDEIFIAAQKNHTPYDILYYREDMTEEELTRYKVLFAPHQEILTPGQSELLRRYVEQGGTLIIGARTGQKDADGHCVMRPMPGLLTDFAESSVEEFTLIGPGDDPVCMNLPENALDTGSFNDILAVSGPHARVLATYASSYYAGKPALIETSVGAGRVLHFGGTFTRENTAWFLDYCGVLHPWKAWIDVPESVEIAVRESAEGQYLFVLNYLNTPQTIEVHKKMQDLDQGEMVSGSMILEGFETKVFLASR